jgi:hypothetical protein
VHLLSTYPFLLSYYFVLVVNPELVESAIAMGKCFIEGKTTPVALTATESDRAIDHEIQILHWGMMSPILQLKCVSIQV